MPKTLSHHYVDKAVSEGTLRPEDLIPNFMDVLTLADRSSAEEISDHFNLDTEDSDEQSELLEALFEALNAVAPKGCYFGAHEGDGACFGFWGIEEDED